MTAKEATLVCWYSAHMPPKANSSVQVFQVAGTQRLGPEPLLAVVCVSRKLKSGAEAGRDPQCVPNQCGLLNRG